MFAIPLEKIELGSIGDVQFTLYNQLQNAAQIKGIRASDAIIRLTSKTMKETYPHARLTGNVRKMPLRKRAGFEVISSH